MRGMPPFYLGTCSKAEHGKAGANLLLAEQLAQQFVPAYSVMYSDAIEYRG